MLVKSHWHCAICCPLRVLWLSWGLTRAYLCWGKLLVQSASLPSSLRKLQEGLLFEHGHSPHGVHQLQLFAYNVTRLRAPLAEASGSCLRARTCEGMGHLHTNTFPSLHACFLLPIGGQKRLVFSGAGFLWTTRSPEARVEHGDPVDLYETGYSRRVFWYPDIVRSLHVAFAAPNTQLQANLRGLIASRWT